MASLFEITGDFIRLYELATEEDEAFADTLESLNFDLANKAEGYVAVIHQLEMEAGKAKELAEALTAKARARENAVKKMKEAILTAMEVSGNKQIDANGYTIRIQKNGGLQPLVIDGAVPDNMTKIIIEPDKKKIREYLKDNECDWAHLEERGKHITIK